MTNPVGEPFRQLFDDNYEYVWRSLRRLGVYEADIEDVTHDVFLAVHQKLATYERTRPVRPWLFAFALRYAADYRKLARHRREAPAVEGTAGGPDAEALVAEREDARRLYRALDSLSLEIRAVIVLYEIDDTPMKDVAEALGIPLNTAYSRLRLARAQCAAALQSAAKELR